jgi:hypothetical protein
MVAVAPIRPMDPSSWSAVMRKLLLGIAIGTALGATVSHFGKYTFGHYMGRLDGLSEAVNAIHDEFGEISSQSRGKALFGLKTSTVVVVEVDGVKTVRVIP